MKKIMAVLFAAALMIGILPMSTFAASTDIVISSHTTGQLSTEIINATRSLISPITSIKVSGGGLDTSDWIAINSAMRTSNQVTEVDLSGATGSYPGLQGIFGDFPSLTTIKLPGNLTSIGNSMLENCTGLTSITIPDTVTSIGTSAFYGCTGLASITIPSNVTSIGLQAFDSCTNLSSVIIQGSVASIEDHAFSGCTRLTSVTIPEGPASIGQFAFNGCSSLTTITIPKSVTAIGLHAFEGCTRLSSVTFSGSAQITEIGDSAFNGDTSLTAITIPASVTAIDGNAFGNCTSLSAVTMDSSHPSQISIGSSAFFNIAQNAVLYVPHGSEHDWDAPSPVCRVHGCR